jgi:hypothetical protein
MQVIASQMRRCNELQLVVENAEYGVAIKVNVRHVAADSIIIEATTEAHPTVGACQREKVLLDRQPIDAGKLFDEAFHGPGTIRGCAGKGMRPLSVKAGLLIRELVRGGNARAECWLTKLTVVFHQSQAANIRHLNSSA